MQNTIFNTQYNINAQCYTQYLIHYTAQHAACNTQFNTQYNVNTQCNTLYNIQSMHNTTLSLNVIHNAMLNTMQYAVPNQYTIQC